MPPGSRQSPVQDRNPRMPWEEWPKAAEAGRPLPTPPGSVLMSLQSCLHVTVLSSTERCGARSGLQGLGEGQACLFAQGEGAASLITEYGTGEGQEPRSPSHQSLEHSPDWLQRHCWGQGWADTWPGPARPFLRLSGAQAGFLGLIR